MMERSYMRPATFVGCAHEFVAEAPELADTIEHDMHVRPNVIAFTGRDTIDIVFCDPELWAEDNGSKEPPAWSLAASFDSQILRTIHLGGLGP